MYTITTFTAQHIPTEYTKPPGGGAPFPMGYENITEYETYDECKAQLVRYSEEMEIAKAIRFIKAKNSGIEPPALTWTSHKMYRDGKQPSLLHHIDNNYPGISLASKA